MLQNLIWTDGPTAPLHHINNTIIVSRQGLLNSPQPSTANTAQQENPHQDQRDGEYQPLQESYGPDNIIKQILHYPANSQLPG